MLYQNINSVLKQGNTVVVRASLLVCCHILRVVGTNSKNKKTPTFTLTVTTTIAKLLQSRPATSHCGGRALNDVGACWWLILLSPLVAVTAELELQTALQRWWGSKSKVIGRRQIPSQWKLKWNLWFAGTKLQLNLLHPVDQYLSNINEEEKQFCKANLLYIPVYSFQCCLC